MFDHDRIKMLAAGVKNDPATQYKLTDDERPLVMLYLNGYNTGRVEGVASAKPSISGYVICGALGIVLGILFGAAMAIAGS